MSANVSHAPCRNCGTVLQGPYCHVCGQQGHDPLRSFAHAVEDVFESFWHLDGRVFRTVRDLLVPGRLAAAYLGGRRAYYLPPLRLFVILTVLTFFVGKLTLHADPIQKPTGTAVAADAPVLQTDYAEIAVARNPAEVLRQRAADLREIRAEADSGMGAWLAPALEAFVRPQLDDAARERMRALGASADDLARLESQIRTDAANDTAASSTGETAQGPVASGPVQRWLVRRALRLRENTALIKREPDAFVRLFLGALPGALFVLVPLFALCLKLLYLRGGRGYLEHLVVALYSHSLMLLALLALFVLVGLQTLFGRAEAAFEVFSALLLMLGVPAYLLLMQKRIYAQNWGWTLGKYTLLGATYLMLLGVAVLYAVLAGLST